MLAESNDEMKPADHYEPSIELILDYLDGILPKKTVMELEHRMSTSEVVASMVEGASYLKSQGKTRKEIEDYLGTLSTTPDSQTLESTNSSSFFWVKIAASVSLVILAIFGINYSSEEGTLQQLATSQLATPYASPDILRDSQDQIDKLWSKAARQYKEKNYGDCIQTLTQIDQLDDDDPTSLFYLGLSNLYLEPKNLDAGIAYLEQVEQTQHLLGERASWYLGLAYLLKSQNDLAKKKFEKTIKLGGFKSREAQELVDRLE